MYHGPSWRWALIHCFESRGTINSLNITDYFSYRAVCLCVCFPSQMPIWHNFLHVLLSHCAVFPQAQETVCYILTALAYLLFNDMPQWGNPRDAFPINTRVYFSTVVCRVGPSLLRRETMSGACLRPALCDIQIFKCLLPVRLDFGLVSECGILFLGNCLT